MIKVLASCGKEINVGVDTGKAQLDIYVRPLEQAFSVPNNTAGIREAIRRLKAVHPTRIVIEATGRLELPFVIAAHKAKLPVCVANPIQIRRFAGATGQLAKSDQLDARMIAYYGKALAPEPTALKPEKARQVSDLLVRRNQLLDMRTMEKNRLSILPKTLHVSLNRHLKQLTTEIKRVEKQLDKRINQLPEWQNKMDQLMSVKGVGKVLA